MSSYIYELATYIIYILKQNALRCTNLNILAFPFSCIPVAYTTRNHYQRKLFSLLRNTNENSLNFRPFKVAQRTFTYYAFPAGKLFMSIRDFSERFMIESAITLALDFM